MAQLAAGCASLAEDEEAASFMLQLLALILEGKAPPSVFLPALGHRFGKGAVQRAFGGRPAEKTLLGRLPA